MNTTTTAAIALTLFASTAAHAQQALQWKVADGGNGHWYQQSNVGTSISWGYAKDAAERSGGHLACLEQSAENAWVWEHVISVGPDDPSEFAGWIGLQQTGGPEPAGGWEWISGVPLTYFDTANFDNAYGFGPESFGCYYQTPTYPAGNWADINFNGCWVNDCVTRYVTEWSADCNADGIVDYGQCHDGTLPDYNGNNIPDCCERGEACVLGNYPVQWRGEDGGNGHWYRIDATSTTWEVARDRAFSQSGYLATITKGSEQRFLSTLDWSIITQWGVWLGARRQSCTWQWVNGESWGYDHWAPNEPSGGCFDAFLLLYVQLGTKYELRWDDCICPPDGTPTGSFIEWSADCNNDGIVDYGQILQGQLADTNTDGIPDTCQCGTIPSLPSCCPGDLDHDATVGGADIGLLLSNWGPCGNACLYDLNNDDKVNGGDLGLLLSGWGPCGN